VLAFLLVVGTLDWVEFLQFVAGQRASGRTGLLLVNLWVPVSSEKLQGGLRSKFVDVSGRLLYKVFVSSQKSKRFDLHFFGENNVCRESRKLRTLTVAL